METIILKDLKYKSLEEINDIIKKILLCEITTNIVLRNHELVIRTFDNCREYGYMYSIKNAIQPVVFSVYQHRNSDQLIINGCLEKDLQSYGAYSGKSKYDYFDSFDYGDYTPLVKTLINYLEETVDNCFDEDMLN